MNNLRSRFILRCAVRRTADAIDGAVAELRSLRACINEAPIILESAIDARIEKILERLR